MRNTARLLLAVLASLAMAPAFAATTAAPPPALDGTAWTLAALPGRSLLADRPATLRFEGGRVSGTDGCNAYSGRYTQAADGFRLGNVAQTQMACPSEPGKQAQAFMAALAAARQARLEGGRLQLLDAAGAPLATLAPQREALADTSWQVTGYNNGRQAVVSVLAGTALSLEFAGPDRLAGSAGCNRFQGGYTQSKRELQILPPAATRRLCAAPAGIMEQEAAFLAALQTATRLRLDGNRLELRTATDSLAIAATRSAPAPTARASAGPATVVAPGVAASPGVTRTFAADMVYFADAALVTVCRDGQRYPVAMEADYLKMERAYSARAKPPGSPVHVTFEGTIVERPKVDGDGTAPTMVVKRFIHAWPGETCERARADANLANTYWKIVRLGATEVTTAAGQREPHVRLRSAARDGLTGDYVATVGCNTIRGDYRVAGQAMTFGAGAATRLGCPPALAALERELGTLLARTARWAITASTLELFDAGGASVGLFQAVYL
jgi:heat shock protein HslJ